MERESLLLPFSRQPFVCHPSRNIQQALICVYYYLETLPFQTQAPSTFIKMKYAFAAAALAATVSAQSLSDIPSCAIPCIDASRTAVTTCTADDYACLCDNITAIQGDATTCVISGCGADVAVSTLDILPLPRSLEDKTDNLKQARFSLLSRLSARP